MNVEDVVPLVLLNCLLLEHTLAIFVVRPFIKPNVSILTPTHHFWPWVPLPSFSPNSSSSTAVTSKIPQNFAATQKPPLQLTTPININTAGTLAPNQHLWPWVPLLNHPQPSPKTSRLPQKVITITTRKPPPKLTTRMDPSISIVGPSHHLWPWVPVINQTSPAKVTSRVPLLVTTTRKPSQVLTTHTTKPWGELPIHNFWPWVPMINQTSPAKVTNRVPLLVTTTRKPSQELTTHTTKPGGELPTHNFWPWIPIVVDDKTNLTSGYGELPTHNFWPFIPVVDVTKTIPTTTPLPKRPWPPGSNRYNYGEVMYKSIRFFEVQRSGWLPENKKVWWRGHSATDDQGHLGEDLSGGWYDSGDYIKFGLPMAAASSLLLWGLVEYRDVYKSQGLLEDMLDCIKWPLDYFLKAHTDRFVFYGQVGDPYLDHAYWGRPEDMNMERPSYKLTPDSPGSDLIAETAAAMAAGYMAFRDVDPAYAKKLLEHAQELFEFAENFRGGYSDSIRNAAEFYGSSEDEDELAWSAAWLYRATNKKFYLRRAEHWYGLLPGCWAQSWADKSCAVPVLLYKLTKEKKYKTAIEDMFYQWLPGGTVHYTSKGLAFRSEWGTLRYTANMAFLSLLAADLDVQSFTYRRWARSQIHYMLGDGGRSYVTGYGYNPPTRPHHASSSCRSPPYSCTWSDYSKDEPNAHTLYGALVGGPGPDDDYEDARDDYIHNEVGCDYNGGFQSAVVALKHLELHFT